MSKLKRIALCALNAFAVAAPAIADDAQPAPKHTCAFVDRIYNFKEIDDYSAIIQTSPSRSYKVTFFNSCREMRWAFSARVEAHPGICLSKGDRIIVGRHGFADRCIVDKVEALPPKAQVTPTSAY